MEKIGQEEINKNRGGGDGVGETRIHVAREEENSGK